MRTAASPFRRSRRTDFRRRLTRRPVETASSRRVAVQPIRGRYKLQTLGRYIECPVVVRDALRTASRRALGEIIPDGADAAPESLREPAGAPPRTASERRESSERTRLRRRPSQANWTSRASKWELREPPDLPRVGEAVSEGPPESRAGFGGANSGFRPSVAVHFERGERPPQDPELRVLDEALSLRGVGDSTGVTQLRDVSLVERHGHRLALGRGYRPGIGRRAGAPRSGPTHTRRSSPGARLWSWLVESVLMTSPRKR